MHSTVFGVQFLGVPWIVCLLFSGFLSVIIVRTVRRDIAQYNKGEELVTFFICFEVFFSYCSS